MNAKREEQTGQPPDRPAAPRPTSREERRPRKQQARAAAAARQRRARLTRWATGTAVVAVAVLAVVLLQLRSEPAVGPDGLPGPRGGPSVAQDVNTLVGTTAPAFTLSDADGTSYTVTPDQGRALVLVSHMGNT